MLRTMEARSSTRKTFADVSNILVGDTAASDEDDEILLDYVKEKATSQTGKKRQKEAVTARDDENSRKKGSSVRDAEVDRLYDVDGDQVGSVVPGKYKNRKNAGTTVISFGGCVASKQVESPVIVRVEPYRGHNDLDEPYRFMFENLRDKAGHLDETICRVGDWIIEKNGLPDDPPHDFLQTSPDAFLCVGRVCCDSPEGRLNPQSVVLQGSQDTTFGKTLAFDPTQVSEYSLFPGQIIAATATNPNGSAVIASKVYSDAAPLTRPHSIGHISEKEPLSVVLASGPFTTCDNLDFEPLKDLLKYVKKTRPHAVFLIGPFLDERNDVAASASETYDLIFERAIRMIMNEMKESSTQVIIVSSSHEMHHLPIFPTPAYQREFMSFDPGNNIFFMADPCMVDISGIVFGLTSTDILFHLGKEEISFPPRSGDRLRRLATHILQQRSFYPLFPPNEEVNLDVSALERHGQLEVQPHVLVLPSDLLHFYKEINGALVVNPGRLTKRECGGVFATMTVRHGNVEDADETFASRVHGQIVRV